jgi:protein involved in polysaccharide export with SLBB domain
MNTTLITGASSRIGRAALDLMLVITLLLIAIAQATQAQQTAGLPRDLSQNSCRQIAVFGAVRTPSRLDAQQRMRLLEVLTRGGGPNEQAGKTVRIVHPCNCSPCDNRESKANDVNDYSLVDVLRGRENGNPYVVPGDIVMVPEADSVFVLGNVTKLRSIRFSEGMTVTRAIAMADAVLKSSALVFIRIHRTSAGASPIIVNLRAAIRDRTEDVVLQPFDVLEVSDDWGHFQSPRPWYPTWDPPLPKWNPPLHPRKETSGSTIITGASRRGSTCCIDSARLPMWIQ